MSTDLKITVTDVARDKFREALDGEDSSDHCIRMGARRITPVRMEYSLDFVAPDEKRADDLTMVAGDVTILKEDAAR